MASLDLARRAREAQQTLPLVPQSRFDAELVVRLAAELYDAANACLWVVARNGEPRVAAAHGDNHGDNPVNGLQALAERAIRCLSPARGPEGVAVPLGAASGAASGAIAVGHPASGPALLHPDRLTDLAQLVEANDRLRRALNTDPLTGAASRLYFLDRLGEACAAGERGALLLFDIDHFKEVNDRHGHLVGDRVLHQVVARVARRVGSEALVGRLGGEEFALLALGVIGDVGVRALATRVCRAVAERAFGDGSGTTVAVTVSIGAAHMAPALEPEALLQVADCALYRAKTAGRNRISVEGLAPGAGSAQLTCVPDG